MLCRSLSPLTLHLNEINGEANKMLSRLIDQTAQAQGITELMNATDQLAWVGAMNCIRSAVEETVLNELICDGTIPKTKKPAGANASAGRRSVEQFVGSGVYQ